MAEFPHLPLFTDAYIADTMHLDCTESGAYLHLLMAAWRSIDCALPNDDKKLCRMARCTPRQWSKMRGTILEFFTLENNKWTQKRLLKERVYVTAKSDQAARAGRASALKRKETGPTSVVPPLEREANGTPTPIPIPIPKEEYNVQFDVFWKQYPLKKSKKDSLKVFTKLMKDGVPLDDIIEGLKKYKKNKPSWQDFALASTWLNGERWNDEYNNKKTGWVMR